MSRVLAVVLNWNGHEMTRRCVEHLRRQNYGRCDLLVVDNGSTDGSVARFAEWGLRPEEILALPANAGFTGGMNAGLEVARGRNYAYAWVLNNDAFVDPDCLARLVEHMEAHPGAGVASPRLVDGECDEPVFGARVDWVRMRVEYLPAEEVPAVLPPDSWYMGAALLARAECLADVGHFDGRFFAYQEDADLCLRCQRAGWEVHYVDRAVCRHVGGATSGGGMSPFVAYMMSRNTWMVLRKSIPLRRRPRAFCRFASESLRQAAAYAGLGNRAAASAQVAGLFAALRGESGPPGRLESGSFPERFLVEHGWGLSVWLDRLTGSIPLRAPRVALKTAEQRR